MKFVCLGYSEEKKWDGMSKSEQEAMFEECFAYDDVLRRNGTWSDRGQALQNSRAAKTLRWNGSKVLITDGPYAETKEQLGGFGVLEAKDINHAVELVSQHPCVRYGPIEIRPIDGEITERCAAAVVSSGSAEKGVTFVCLGYFNENNWNALSQEAREALIDDCMAYDKVLRKYGQSVGGVALQNVKTAKTLRSKDGKVLVTDGPFAETKEQLGGVATYRFEDMDQAIKAWSEHPCLRVGDCLELRQADEEINARVAAREALVAAH